MNTHQKLSRTEQSWKRALDKFLVRWKTRRDVLGVLLTGTFATGLFTRHSDIDVYIVLSSNARWAEMGDVVIDGFLIGYFANPPQQIRLHFNEIPRRIGLVTVNMFAIGRVLFDKTGIVKELKSEALTLASKRPKRMNKFSVEYAKYRMWDDLNHLRDCYEDQPLLFDFLYYYDLRRILDTYSSFLRVPLPDPHKMQLFFQDAEFRHRHRFRELHDRAFVKHFLGCLEGMCRIRRLEQIEALVDYTLNKMGGFKIDGWRLRRRVTARGSEV